MASLILRVHAKASGAKRVPKNRAKEVKKEIQNIMRKIGNVGVNNIRSEIKKRRLQKTGEMFKSVTYSMTTGCQIYCRFPCSVFRNWY